MKLLVFQISNMDDFKTRLKEGRLTPEESEEVMKLAMEAYEHYHTPYVRKYKKISRNETCPYCDSGKKFKNCECYKTYGRKSVW